MDYDKFVETITKDIDMQDEDYCKSAKAYEIQEYANRACACGSVKKVLRECVEKRMRPLDIAVRFTSLANNFYIRCNTIHHESVGVANYCDLLPKYALDNMDKIADMLFDYYIVFDIFAKRAEELSR